MISVCLLDSDPYDLTQHDATVGTGTVEWYDGDPSGAGVPFADATVADLSASPDVWAVVTSVDGCPGVVDVTLSVNVEPVATISGALDYCAGGSTDLSAPAGAGLTYAWSDGTTTTQMLTVSSPGDYTVTVSDGNGCSATDMVTVTELANPTVSLAADAAEICSGDVVTYTLTGTPGASVTYDGPTPGTVTLDGTTGEAQLPFTGGASDITVTLQSVTDGTCSQTLSGSLSVTVSQPSDAGTGGSLVVCGGGDTNLTADIVSALGGTPDAGGSWSDDGASGVDLTDPSSVDFTGVAPGPYGFTYTVGGTGSCPDASSTVTVTVSAAPVVTVVGTSCSADLSTYDVDVTVPSGTVASDAGTVIDNTGGSYTVAGVPSNTTVTITSTDGTTGCSSSATAFDDCPCPVLSAPASGGDMSVCDGGSVPALTVSVDPGLTADWYDSAAGGVLLSGGTLSYAPSPQPGIGATSYFAESVDPVSGCTGPRTEVVLTVDPNPTAAAGSLSVCDDDADGFAPFTLTDADAQVLGGQTGMTVTYHDSQASADGGTGALSSPYTNVLSGTQPLVVRVEDANGCYATAGVVLTVDALPVFTVDPTDASGSAPDDGAVCAGDPATLTVSLGGQDYSWSDGTTTAQSLTVSPAVTTTYTVTVTDASGCSSTGDFEVVVDAVPVATLTVTEASGTLDNDGTICEGDAVTIGVSEGGLSYLWSDGGSATQTIAVGPVSTTTYTVTVTSAAGCTSTSETTITVNPLPVPSIAITENSGTTPDDGILCDGDAATLDAGTFASYEWSNAGEITPTISVNTSGDYTVTVTSADGCTATSSVSITVNPLPVPSIVITENSGTTPDDGILCAGDAATLDAGTFAGYEWSNAGEITPTISVSTSGDYTVTVTTADGCTATSSVSITVNPLPVPSIAITENSGTTPDDGILCAGDAATLDAGTFAGYEWSNAGEITPTISVNTSGDYTVTVTDVNGCEATASVSITVNTLPSTIISISETSGIANDDGILCAGDAATLDAGTFDSYVWSNAGEITPTISVSTSGDYTVTVTTADGCTAEATTSIVVNPLPIANIAVTDASGTTNDDGIICEGDLATLDAGTFASYEWSNAGEITSTITTTTGGTFTVTVTDANGCTATASTTIISNPIPTPSIAITDSSGAANDDGILCAGDAAILDAGAFAGYEWSNAGEITPTISVTAAGIYTVTVTSADGCTATATATIITNPNPVPNISGTLEFCAGECTVLDAGIFDSYEWSNGNMTQTPTICIPGDYTVTVTEGGCTGTAMVTVVENPLPVPSITGNLSFCDGGSTTLTADPGYVNYAWSPTGNTATIVVNNSGIYTVTVTDTNGCTGTASATVTSNPNPVPVITGDPVICLGSTTTLDAGAGYASYAWSGGGASQTLVVNSANNYVVTVTDANGCQGTASFNVAEEAPLSIQIETPDNLTCDMQSVTLDASATNNVASYQWTTTSGIIDSGANTATPTVSSAGVYTLTAFSALGCPTSADVTVLANPFTLTDIYITTTEPECYGDLTGTIVIDSVEGGIEPYLFSFNGEAFTSQTSYIGLGAGNYSITVMDSEGCEFTENVLIDQPPLVTLDLYPVDTLIQLGDSVQLEGFVNPNVLLGDTTWTQTTGLSCTDCLDPWAAPLQNTLYELIVADTNGCSATATALIRVENQELVYIPNAFTPNNDGANDVFMVYGGAGIANVRTFRVFDRWGEIMFKADNFQPNDPGNGWDGKFNGKKLNPAVFVYYAEIEYVNGRVEIYKGDVTLVSGGE